MEKAAADHIISQGGQIITTNYRCRMGEIDIIARDGDTICFIEVKYRKDIQKGYPVEAVDIRKQFTICRVSDHFRMVKALSDERPYRYDVISITGECIRWIKNAFSYISL